MLAGFRVAVAMHAGFDESARSAWDELDLSLAPPFLGDLPVLGPLTAMLGVGDVERARLLYDRMAPVATWSPPRFLSLYLLVLRLAAAVKLNRLDDLRALVDRLAVHDGAHVAASAGGLTYSGPVRLWTGIGRSALGSLDEAVTDLEDARHTCTQNGAVAFAVHATVELCLALTVRDDPGDRRRAAALLLQARPTATALGMTPFVAAIDDLATSGPTDGPAARPLSPRELEVAGLVAEGLTNRAIAERLYLSERTAQNHVQHILTKLGLANRAQIATWFTAR